MKGGGGSQTMGRRENIKSEGGGWVERRMACERKGGQGGGAIKKDGTR